MKKIFKKEEALNKCRKICAGQEMCKLDIFRKLSGWGLSDRVILEIIEQLIKDKFIDEARFAGTFTREKVVFNKWGTHKISYALKQKKISERVIEEAFVNMDREEYEEMVISEMKKKAASLKSKPAIKKRGALFNFGKQRGYENEIIKRTIDELFT